MEVSLLPLTFSLSLTVVSRLLHPHTTDEKTTTLMAKRFSTVRNLSPQKEEGFIEKKRGRREIEVTRRRCVEVKRGDSNQASNHIPK